MTDAEWSASETERLVKPLGRRWLHVQAVTKTAVRVAVRAELDPTVLASAGWLHHIGYAPQLHDTGFHPVDGARHIRRQRVDKGVVSLVAHHSFSSIEAELRGQDEGMAGEFPTWDSAYDDALCYCDMTTGPDGGSVAAEERMRVPTR